MTTLEKNIYNQLTENTGTHFLDSGGENGRAWQRNKLNDIRKKPLFEVDTNTDDECIIYVSSYHHLTDTLETDDITAKINRIIGQNKDVFWVQEIAELLEEKMYFDEISQQFNTYNWGSPLTQDITYINLELNGEHYVLLQTHNGADIRGGYSSAKCYKYIDFYDKQISPIISVDNMQGEFLQSGEGYFSEKINEETIYIG